MGLSEVSVFHSIERELKYASPMLFGGYDDAERLMARFGDPDSLGYEEAFPIDLLEISPLSDKFADDLTHRDFLGALMSLGIQRSLLGDIVPDGRKAYIFCMAHISDYIIENLSSVRHTSVSVKRISPEETSLKKTEMTAKIVQTASLRCDAVVSKVYSLSRNDSAELFQKGKVFVNGRLTENPSHILKERDTVTVRGFGRFVFSEAKGTSRKGNTIIEVGYIIWT